MPKRYDGLLRLLPDIFHSKPVSCLGFAQELKAMLKRSKKENVLCSMFYIFSFLVLGVSFELPMPIQSNRRQKIVKDGITSVNGKISSVNVVMAVNRPLFSPNIL